MKTMKTGSRIATASRILTVLAFGLFLFTGTVDAQEKKTDTTALPDHHAPIVHPAPGSSDPSHDLASAAANPLANMISLPIQNNFNFNYGANEQFQYNVNLLPVLTYKLNKNLNMTNRLSIPISVTPNSSGGYDSGLGNTIWQTWVVPKPRNISKGWTLTWGLGPALSIPTATSPALGGGPFAAGADALIVLGSKHIVAGFLVGFVYSYINDGAREIFAQYFITYNIKNGWFINMNPSISGNLKGAEGEQWIVPAGIGGGKVIKIGKVPAQWNLLYFRNLTTPDVFYDNSIQFQLMLMFPTKPKK